MIRKPLFGVLILGFVLIGMVAQAGSYLLAFASPVDTAPDQASSRGLFAEPGPHDVGVRQLGTVVAPLTIWYPALTAHGDDSRLAYSYAFNMIGPDTATAVAIGQGRAKPDAPADLWEGPYPLVALSHGYAITPSSYAWLAEHLASHGMVVVAPHHREGLDPGALWSATVERPRDISNALDFVEGEVRPGGQLDGLIDTETVAVVGHSYGGYAALAAAGARIDTAGFDAACASSRSSGDPLAFLCDALDERFVDMAKLAGLDSDPPGLWPAWSDGRVDAVVSIAGDAAMFGSDGLAEVEVPLMAIGGTADTDSPFEWGTQLAFDHVGSPRKVEIALDGAEHLIFAGECHRPRRILRLAPLGFCSDPAWDRAEAHDLVKAEVTAFLRSELHHDQEAAAALSPGLGGQTGVARRSEGY